MDYFPALALNERDGSLLVLVPEGPFAAGGAGVLHGWQRFQVGLASYYIGLHPVTNAQYARFVAETGHRPPSEADRGSTAWVGDTYPPALADHPVTCVDWDDAQAYCAWAGMRLPTELEWEKGIRGSDGRKYPWGNFWSPARGLVSSEFTLSTSDVWDPAGAESAWGLFHAAGSVRNWCADNYDERAYDRYRLGDFTCPEGGAERAVRGGSWRDGGSRDQCAVRSGKSPWVRADDLGFRCARHALAPPPWPGAQEGGPEIDRLLRDAPGHRFSPGRVAAVLQAGRPLDLIAALRHAAARGQEGVPVLGAALQCRRWPIAAVAVQLLGEIPGGSHLRELFASIASPWAPVRLAAIQAIGRQGLAALPARAALEARAQIELDPGIKRAIRGTLAQLERVRSLPVPAAAAPDLNSLPLPATGSDLDRDVLPLPSVRPEA